LIGINSVAGGGQGQNVGIGFAIPSNMAIGIMRELIEAGRVRRGSTGLLVEDLSDDIVDKWGGTLRGAMVKKVLPGSSAEGARIKRGDIVVSAMGKPVRDASEFATRTAAAPLGSRIPIILFADGTGRSVSLLSQDTVVEPDIVSLGIEAGTLSGASVGNVLIGNLRYGEVRGTQIISIAAGSPAQQAGLRPDDVIVSINERPTRSVEELSWRIEQSSSKFRITIDRVGQPAFLNAEK
jgi:S1-C subfamily serine protease